MATGQKASRHGSEELLTALRRRRGQVVDAYLAAVIPGYERSMDPQLGDLRDASERTADWFLAALVHQRPASPGELDFGRPYVRHALLRGATEADLLRAARLWQRVLWDFLAEQAGEEGAQLLPGLAGPLMDYMESVSETVTATVAEIQTAQRMTSRASRRELLEALVAGRELSDTSRLETARSCGLGPEGDLVVVSARPVGDTVDAGALAVAAVTLARAPGDVVEPLYAVRDDEIVLVRAMPDDPQKPVEALTGARRQLEATGIVLRVGMSAVHRGLGAVSAAYDEARMAREQVGDAGGFVALALLKPLDYLFLRGADDAAWNLVPRSIREFVEADLSQAGLLVETLMAYVDCNLNVKAAAKQLFVHPNTAHYRLAKIEELTGCDLRDLVQLIDLVMAVRLARQRAA